MNTINTNLNSRNNMITKNDEFINNINLSDLSLILKQATTEINDGIKGTDAYEGLDKIELEVFGELLQNRN